MYHFIKNFLYSRRLKKKAQVYQKKIFLKKKNVVRNSFLFHKKKIFLKFFIISRLQKLIISGVNIYSVLLLRGLRSGALINSKIKISRNERGVEVNSVVILKKKVGVSGGSFIKLDTKSWLSGGGLSAVHPSGVKLFFNLSFLKKCSMGRSFLLSNYRAKYSKFFFKKIKSAVRGVAKNANEHYNGGKGRSGVLRGYSVW